MAIPQQSFFTSEVNIISSSLRGDSIISDKVATGLLGEYRDSVFGKVTAAVTLQPLLPTNFLMLGTANEQLIADSLILTLPYLNLYGDTTAQQVEVYEVAEELSIEKIYYSNYVPAVESGILGSKQLIPRLNENILVKRPDNFGNVNTEAVDPQLRVKLDHALAAEILNASGTADLSNDDNFKKFLKGFYLKVNNATSPVNNQYGIMYLRLTASNSKLSLFYTTINNANDSIPKVVDFPLKSSSVRFNTFQHDYSNSVVENKLDGVPDSVNFYLQTMGGVQASIQFPDLKNQLGNKNILINKAELIVPAINGSYVEEGFPSSILVLRKNEAGILQIIPDIEEGASYYGGILTADNTYRFNIARYMQKLIDGDYADPRLYFYINGAPVNAQRLVIGGPAAPANQKIKLNLYYSKLN